VSEVKRRTEENIEDVRRISDILNCRIKKSGRKLGPRAIKKNPFLNPDGSFNLIEKFPEYESRRNQKKRGILFDRLP